jgi:hypothetical protein
LLAILFHAAGNTTHTILPSVWWLLGLEQSDPSVTASATNELRIFLFQIGVRWLLAIVVLIVAGRELGRRPLARPALLAKPAS